MTPGLPDWLIDLGWRWRSWRRWYVRARIGR